MFWLKLEKRNTVIDEALCSPDYYFVVYVCFVFCYLKHHQSVLEEAEIVMFPPTEASVVQRAMQSQLVQHYEMMLKIKSKKLLIKQESDE